MMKLKVGDYIKHPYPLIKSGSVIGKVTRIEHPFRFFRPRKIFITWINMSGGKSDNYYFLDSRFYKLLEVISKDEAMVELL